MVERRLAIAGCAALAALLLTLAGCRGTGAHREDSVNAGLFLARLAALEGMTFEGQVDESFTPRNPFEGERLVMHVEQANSQGARIALRVGEDRSRTWVLTRSHGGLHLRHDHRDPDGTPHSPTDYGGHAAPGGSPYRQRFPADSATAKMLPEAATNEWVMEIVPGSRFVYQLTRHGEPRFRAIFDLTP